MSKSEHLNSVWVFHGLDARFAAAVFRTKECAEEWIHANGVQGILTEYPLDISAYEWCIDKGYFTPKNDEQRQPKFKQQFTHAAQDHEHYEDEDPI